MDHAIENLDWQITTSCNRNCPYCFGPKGYEPLSFDDICRLIQVFKELGVRQVGLAGGEPLMHPQFSDIVNLLRSEGFSIYLSTNCDLYEEFADLIKAEIAIIGVPLDGACRETHELLRGKSSFHAVIAAIDDIGTSDCATKLKVGTVLTKYNVGELYDMERMLSHYADTLLYWKLHHLVKYERNRQEVSKLEPEQLSLQNLGFLLGEKIVDSSLSDRDRSYFFLRPDAEVFVPLLKQGLSEERSIGNLLKDDASLIRKRFYNLVNWEGYYAPHRYMHV